VVGKNGIILLKMLAGSGHGRADTPHRGTHHRPAQALETAADGPHKSYSRSYDYAQARDDMFAATDSEWAPWFATRSDDKRRLRLNIIKHLLKSIPYEVPKPAKITLPKR